MFDNHGYKNIVTYLSGVTRQSIKMQKTSEIVWISEVFRYPQPAFLRRIWLKPGQAESTVHMLNWAVRSVKFLGVEFDQSEDEEVAVSDTTHL